MFANVTTFLPLFLNAINTTNFLEPIDLNLPINKTSNQTCSFAHLPNSTDNYRQLDPRCANDVNIIGQEMHVVESGLYANDYLVTTGTVVTNIGRMICLDNVVKFNQKHQIITEPTTIIIKDMQHRFTFTEGKYSERHANILPNQYPTHNESPVTHPDQTCDEYGFTCGDWIPNNQDLVWCHRGCSNDGFGGVNMDNWPLTGKPGDCVTLFDINNKPTITMVKISVKHGNNTVEKNLQTDITLNDKDIARISTDLVLSTTRLIGYQGAVYDGNLGDTNSYATANYDLNFAYNCVKPGEHSKWRSRIENVITWNVAYPRLPTNRVLLGSTNEMIQFTDASNFNSSYFDNSSMVAYGGQNIRVTYTFKTYSKIKTIFQVNGAVEDFECYFKGESLDKVQSFTCVVTKVAIKGVANLLIYNTTGCAPLYTGQIQAALRAQIIFPVISSGQNQTMKVCTQLGRCKTYAYSTERIIINPTDDPSSTSGSTYGFNWDWLGDFFGTLFHAISWWWNSDGWLGKLKSFATVLAMIIVVIATLYGLFYLKKVLWMLKIFRSKKEKKISVDSTEGVQKSVVINL